MLIAGWLMWSTANNAWHFSYIQPGVVEQQQQNNIDIVNRSICQCERTAAAAAAAFFEDVHTICLHKSVNIYKKKHADFVPVLKPGTVREGLGV